jgi:hypothetical protein
MYKPDSLREHLSKAIKDLRQNPDKLHVFLDDGSALATNTASMSLMYEYVLNLIVTDINKSAIDAIFVPLVAWMKVHQPEAFANEDNRKKAIRFEVDVNSATSVDLSIKLVLSERLIVKREDGGRLNLSPAAEPQLTPPYADEFWTLYDGSNLLAEWTTPTLP